ncbi:unnamed protein product [Trichogramma brassicae]|uniref:Uncharacterized protein n=1 Tax=Trichogramma brassicae TaxID=86971 RepID=A0A6H5IH38_9HYME|nr:unnamed protein product [Trichogramma brassicae]
MALLKPSKQSCIDALHHPIATFSSLTPLNLHRYIQIHYLDAEVITNLVLRSLWPRETYSLLSKANIAAHKLALPDLWSGTSSYTCGKPHSLNFCPWLLKRISIFSLRKTNDAIGRHRELHPQILICYTLHM